MGLAFDIAALVLTILLIMACGMFVAAEFSFVIVDRAKVSEAVRQGSRKAAGLDSALGTLSTQLSGAQIGITITNLAIGFLAEPSIAALIHGPLAQLGIPDAAITTTALVIALVLSTALTAIFGELVPKNMAIARPMRTAQTVQGFMRGFTKVTSWLIRFTNGSANALLHRLGVEATETLNSARPPSELLSLVTHSEARGTLESETANLLRRSLLFSDRDAESVMTPRVRMESLEEDETVQDVISRTKATGYSRFPVTGEDLDDIVGIVHVKKAIAVPSELRDTLTVAEIMSEPVVVPSTMELDPLLDTLRSGYQLAVVVDEFGGTDGIVTMEDLLEELVGDVTDEHDRPDFFTHRNIDGSWTISGLLRPDELLEATEIDVPEDDEYETVAGYLTVILERIPEVGDEVFTQTHCFTVTAMDGHRVDRINVTALPEPEDTDENTTTDTTTATAADANTDVNTDANISSQANNGTTTGIGSEENV